MMMMLSSKKIGTIGFTTLLLLLSLVVILHSVHARNPFSSNVVELTSSNFKDEVEDYPHGVFINICRQGWGYCQRLNPEWERLAGAVKGTVKVAYWDTEQQRRMPPLLGEIKGTPTIRFYKPKPKQTPGYYRKKIVMDYNYERKATDMKRFVDENMPNFVEKVNSGLSDLTKFLNKANRNALPKALLFTSKAGKTSNLTKFLSTEFRRKLLLAEVKPTKPNQAILDKSGIKDLPALVIIPVGEENDDKPSEQFIKYESDKYTKIKLVSFLKQHALKEAVTPAPKKKPTEAPSKVGEGDAKKETEKKEEKKKKPTKKEEKEEEEEPPIYVPPSKDKFKVEL